MHRLRILALCACAAVVPGSVWAQQRAASGSPQLHASNKTVLVARTESSFSLVQGNALNWNNDPLPESLVRLRDARFGRILGTQLTDRAGLFSFQRVDPGAYVVELIGRDQTVLAASELLSASAGDVISAIVKLPLKQTGGGLFGHGMQQALAIMSAAAATGVLATNVTGADASAR
jgi:hypothetical protein